MGKAPDKKVIKEIKKFKERVSRKYKVDKIILFGSRARGSYKKESDVDLTIISKDFKKIKFLDRSRGLYLTWGAEYPVDFFCYTPEEFKKMKKRLTIGRMIHKEGIAV